MSEDTIAVDSSRENIKTPPPSRLSNSKPSSVTRNNGSGNKKLIWDYGVMPSSSGSAANSTNGSALNLGEKDKVAIAQPELIQQYFYPISAELTNKIINTRELLRNILHQDFVRKDSSPLLIIAGPTYITCPTQAKACSNWLNLISVENATTNAISAQAIKDRQLPKCIEDIYTGVAKGNRKLSRNDVLIAMRANLLKRNIDYDQIQKYVNKNKKNETLTVQSFEIQKGIPICRSLLCELAEQVPLAGQLSDTLTPQYLSDLFCLSLVGSSLVESQLHRELVSGSSFPVGFQTLDSDAFPTTCDSFQYKIKAVQEAILASENPHHFLSVTKLGQVAIIGTTGNRDTFIVLELSNEKGFQLSEDDIDKIFEKLNQSNSPKVLVDVGVITKDNYYKKLRVLQTLLVLNPVVSRKVLGVLINSGSLYVTESKENKQKDGTVSTFEEPQNDESVFNFQQTASFENLREQLSREDLTYKTLNDEMQEASKQETSVQEDNGEPSIQNSKEKDGNKSKNHFFQKVSEYTQKLLDIKKFKGGNKSGEIKSSSSDSSSFVDDNEEVYKEVFEEFIYANKLIFELAELSAERNCLLKENYRP